MVGKQDLILVLEEYEDAFRIRLLDKRGFLYSENQFKGMPAVMEVRVLVSTMTHIFGNFNRVTYSRNFNVVWDHPARPDSFGKFMAELFATHNRDGWEGFSAFLERQEQERHRNPTKDLPF
ncbi:hypothetical protein [Planococcus shenhongbingii]|uniref:Uncharacterized protein n=1 Tax=Planococcus shenhongbingii TaxID=3058398 RepID=A0ABT8N9N9_9BACL|nr:hypothetical protein [Planococcus sp. N017]MDN7244600.1 hypothetical protein [Planococcus sp. N017]